MPRCETHRTKRRTGRLYSGTLSFRVRSLRRRPNGDQNIFPVICTHYWNTQLQQFSNTCLFIHDFFQETPAGLVVTGFGHCFFCENTSLGLRSASVHVFFWSCSFFYLCVHFVFLSFAILFLPLSSPCQSVYASKHEITERGKMFMCALHQSSS